MGISHSNINSLHSSHHTRQSSQESFQKQKNDFFIFLKKENKPPVSASFFSENGLSRDILTVTGAEPDVALEVFYALYHTLWPQIEKTSDVSFKDAWTHFIGGNRFKGGICPPEKLILERKIKYIKQILSYSEGEGHIFRNLDQVVSSISDLKQKVLDYPGQLIYKEEIIESLNLLQDFYLKFRAQVKTLVQAILEKEQINASSVSEYDALDDLLEPKAIMMSDMFPHHWAYRISRNKARKLLSMDAFSDKMKSTSSTPFNHRVTALPENTKNPLVFFKANGNPPIQPEKEFMIYSLYKHLQIPVPETALLILTDVFETNSDYFYAVQASEAVIGESPLKAYQNSETFFEREAYVSQVIGALLTNPSDGSFKNFKYSPKYETFISVCNELVFKPELIFDNLVNTRSMLYFMPEIDLAIPESVKAFFMTLDPHLMILLWLQDLSQKNRDYQILFARLPFQKTRCLYQNLLPHNKVPSLETRLQKGLLVDPDLPFDSFYPQVLVSQSLMVKIAEKLQRIEKTLQNPHLVNTQALFEEISPALGKFYRKLRLESSDLEAAMEALWGDKKDGVDYSSISSLLDQEEFSCLSKNVIEQQNNIESFPEVFFEEYKSILASRRSSLDNFIRRHNHRRKKNVLNLQGALNELRLLIQEGLIDSQSIRDIVDFCYNISKMKITDHDQTLVKELTSLFSNLPHAELKWLFTLEKYFRRANHDVLKEHISFSIPVNGAFMKQRTFILTKSEKKYLFDQQGNIKKNMSLTGRSPVTSFPKRNPYFYLKQYPEFPGYEFATTLFMRLLGIQRSPYHDLLIIDSKYPVLLTQKINGQPVLCAWHDPQAFSNLDPFHIGLLIISAILLNPEDGKEDNFILTLFTSNTLLSWSLRNFFLFSSFLVSPQYQTNLG